jgi:hypothetical protein
MHNSVLGLYNGFVRHLEKKRFDIAPLQLAASSMEDRLVKEFVSYVHESSEGKRFAFTNVGNTGNHERRIDICLLSGELRTKSEENISICGFIEAKYLIRSARLAEGNDDDNILQLLKKLHGQATRYPPFPQKHGGYRVSLPSGWRVIHCLVFAAHASKDTNNGKEDFFAKVQRKAVGLFTFLEGHEVLSSAWEDTEVETLSAKFRVSLRVGLWQPR